MTKAILLHNGMLALVSDHRFEFLNQWKWRAHRRSNKCYAERDEKQEDGTRVCIHMHRLITDAPEEMDVDHRDGNGLNNTDNNLRVCTPAQNRKNRRLNKNNRTGFKGVSPHHNKWRAAIKVDYKLKHLGLYDTPEQAASAYDDAALKYRGEFANLNFPSTAQ